MTTSFINQENDEILQKLIGELIHIKFHENLRHLNSLHLLYFYDYTDKSILIPLKSTLGLKYQKHDLQETRRFVNKNCTDHKLLFLKKLTCLSLFHKD